MTKTTREKELENENATLKQQLQFLLTKSETDTRTMQLQNYELTLFSQFDKNLLLMLQQRDMEITRLKNSGLDDSKMIERTLIKIKEISVALVNSDQRDPDFTVKYPELLQAVKYSKKCLELLATKSKEATNSEETVELPSEISTVFEEQPKPKRLKSTPS